MMAVGVRLGKALGEVLELSSDELALWAGFFELEAEKRDEK